MSVAVQDVPAVPVRLRVACSCGAVMIFDTVDLALMYAESHRVTCGD